MGTSSSASARALRALWWWRLFDEPGYVVSGVTEDGYLRLHRRSAGAIHPLFHEYQLGQPILIRTAAGAYVNGVTATPSTHLRGTRPPGADAAPRTIDDLFVDVGAATLDELATRGIRTLDSVTRRQVGFEISSINEDGTAVVRGLGGMYLSLYEGHPVVVHTPGGPRVSPKGAIGVGLSWPGRYSHSPVEVMDRRDLESLTRLLVVLAEKC